MTEEQSIRYYEQIKDDYREFVSLKVSKYVDSETQYEHQLVELEFRNTVWPHKMLRLFFWKVEGLSAHDPLGTMAPDSIFIVPNKDWQRTSYRVGGEDDEGFTFLCEAFSLVVVG